MFYVKALRQIRTMRGRRLNTTSYDLHLCLNLCSDLILALPQLLFVHLIAEQGNCGWQRGNRRGSSGECNLLKDRMNISRQIKTNMCVGQEKIMGEGNTTLSCEA